MTRPDPELLKYIARYPLRKVVREFEQYRDEERGGEVCRVFEGFMVELNCGHIERSRGRKSHRCTACGFKCKE